MLRRNLHAAAFVGVVGILAACYAVDRHRQAEAALLRARLWRALRIARRFRRERNMAREKATDLGAAFQRAVQDWDAAVGGEEVSPWTN